MVLFPPSGLGRFLLFVIVLSTVSYLVLNLVSFGGTSWITYVDIPVTFGLWRVCDTTTSGPCNQWTDDTFSSNFTTFAFPNGKPGFVRSSQALEIISLIFYVIAAALIIIGILDLDGLSYRILFIAAAILLFICIVFLSASLGLMSDQGRNNHPGSFLDWAWWNGLVGLIMTIIDVIALIALVLDMMRYSSSSSSPYSSTKMSRGAKGNNIWSSDPSSSYMLGGNSLPIIAPNALAPQPMNHFNNNQYPPLNSFNHYLQNPMVGYGGQFPINQFSADQFPSNQFYGNQFYGGQPFNDQNPSPILSALARQYILQVADAQYERQLLGRYGQY